MLLLLTEQNGELSVLFIKRTETVEHHKWQISFPGGARDVTDGTIVDTVLREAEEEIGLPRYAVDVLGVLDDFETPSGFCITPVVGYTPLVAGFTFTENRSCRTISCTNFIFS